MKISLARQYGAARCAAEKKGCKEYLQGLAEGAKLVVLHNLLQAVLQVGEHCRQLLLVGTRKLSALCTKPLLDSCKPLCCCVQWDTGPALAEGFQSSAVKRTCAQIGMYHSCWFETLLVN